MRHCVSKFPGWEEPCLREGEKSPSAVCLPFGYHTAASRILTSQQPHQASGERWRGRNAQTGVARFRTGLIRHLRDTSCSSNTQALTRRAIDHDPLPSCAHQTARSGITVVPFMYCYTNSMLGFAVRCLCTPWRGRTCVRTRGWNVVATKSRVRRAE